MFVDSAKFAAPLCKYSDVRDFPSTPGLCMALNGGLALEKPNSSVLGGKSADFLTAEGSCAWNNRATVAYQ